MASASTTVNVTCPHCDKVLRLSKRPADGKKIKCPACAEVFTPELDDEDEGAAIQERPNLKAKAKSSSRNRVDDDDDAPKKRRRDEDDEDDDDRPAKKKKGKQKAGSNMLIFGLIGAGAVCLVLACGGVGLTAFVWPGFMLSKDTKVAETKKAATPDQPGKEQPLPGGGGPGNPPQPPPPQPAPARGGLAAYVMPDADLVMGANVKGLRDANQLDGMLTAFQAAQPNGLPAEFKDVVRDCEKVLMSAKATSLANQVPAGGPGGFGPGLPFGGKAKAGPKGIGGPKGFGPKGKGGPGGQPFGAPPAAPPKVAIAVQMANADAGARVKNIIKNVPGIGAEEQLAGKYPAYRLRSPAETTIFAFPSDRIVVIAPISDQEVIALLDKASRNEAASAQLAKMTGMVEQSHFWVAYAADAQVRALLAGMALQMGGPAGGLPAAAQDGMQALGKVRGTSVAVDSVAGGSWKVQVHLDCDDAAGANGLKNGGDFLKNIIQIEMQKKLNDPSMPRTLMQDFNTLTFAAQGTVASGSLSISAQTIQDLTQLGKAFAGGPGPVGPGPGPIGPGPGPGPIGPGPGPGPVGPGPGPIGPGPAGQPQNYNIVNLPQQSANDKTIRLQQGKKITVTAVYSSINKNNYVDLYVFQGPVQQNKIPAYDEKAQNPNRRGQACMVTFVVPVTGDYTIRVLNRGPGATRNCSVTIREQ